mmetsp:Transcript_21121/g.37997  ORF Transcript_21121/g.37997 Transcript_21121/m.37997 type:complete len:290 (+) Transcript_21121:53-922(+)
MLGQTSEMVAAASPVLPTKSSRLRWSARATAATIWHSSCLLSLSCSSGLCGNTGQGKMAVTTCRASPTSCCQSREPQGVSFAHLPSKPPPAPAHANCQARNTPSSPTVTASRSPCSSMSESRTLQTAWWPCGNKCACRSMARTDQDSSTDTGLPRSGLPDDSHMNTFGPTAAAIQTLCPKSSAAGCMAAGGETAISWTSCFLQAWKKPMTFACSFGPAETGGCSASLTGVHSSQMLTPPLACPSTSPSSPARKSTIITSKSANFWPRSSAFKSSLKETGAPRQATCSRS